MDVPQMERVQQQHVAQLRTQQQQLQVMKMKENTRKCTYFTLDHTPHSVTARRESSATVRTVAECTNATDRRSAELS